MDIFNKKKIKSLEWDLMAVKARLETKENEFNRLQEKTIKFMNNIAQIVKDKYVGQTISYSGSKYNILDFTCDGGVPVFKTEDGVINSNWKDIINGFIIVNPKSIKKAKK